jgi:hypothetical protein
VKHSPILLLLLAALCLVPQAHAAIPALPEIPAALPEAVREPLIAKRTTLALKRQGLIAEGEANTRQCASVVQGSAEHQACLSKLGQFNAKVETLRGERDRLADEVDAAIAAEIHRLQAEDARLTRSINTDITAINNLGFARRAEDFQEWVKLAKGAQKQFEEECKTQAIDIVTSLAQEKMFDALKGMDSARLKRLIELLEKEKDPTKEATLKALRELSAAKAIRRADMAKEAAVAATAIDRGIQGALGEKREDQLRLWLDMICDFSEMAEVMKGCHLVKAELLVVTAALYNNASRRVTRHEIERLTQMTEDQLRGLKKINEVLVEHVKERNAVRAKIKELE